MKTIDGLPLLIDEDGEARELTDADFARARQWRPGDPIGTKTPATALRTAAADLREAANALNTRADALTAQADAIDPKN